MTRRYTWVGNVPLFSLQCAPRLGPVCTLQQWSCFLTSSPALAVFPPFPIFCQSGGICHSWFNFHFFDYSSYTLLIIWASPSANFLFIPLAHFSTVSNFSCLFKQVFYILFYFIFFLYFLNVNLLLVFDIEVSSPRVNPSVILSICYFV